jgi:N-acetylglucosamine kinase-like BadF-type ATPase
VVANTMGRRRRKGSRSEWQMSVLALELRGSCARRGAGAQGCVAAPVRYHVARMKCVLAADLGGTKCRVALVTEDQRVLAAQRIPTNRDRSVFLPSLDAAFAAALAARPDGIEMPSAVGVGTAGVITADGQTIEMAPNLPLDRFPMVQHLRDSLGLPAALLNDGRASAMGEHAVGKARGADPLLCLFFGTGIGIGLIVGGRPYAGADNAGASVLAEALATSKPIVAVVRSRNGSMNRSALRLRGPCGVSVARCRRVCRRRAPCSTRP